MANQNIFSRIVIWSETTSDWASGTFETVLLKGEIGFEYPDSTGPEEIPVPKAKVGDGVHTFEELPYFTLTEKEIRDAIKTAVQNVKIAVDDSLSESSVNPVQNKVITGEINDLKDKVADLLYEAIKITAFSNTVNTVEMGSTVNDITFNWNYSKKPTKLEFNSEIIDVNLKTKALTEQNLTTNKTFTLKATDERGATDTKTTAVSFLNGVYWGAAEVPDSYDSAFILKLTKGLQGSKGKTFTVTAGANDCIFYVVPTRYGACKFNVGGFDGGFTKVSTVQFTNASGYTESYDVYKSDNKNLGNTTVKVS